MNQTMTDDDLLRERLSRENELARLARMASEAPGAGEITLVFLLDPPQPPITLPLPLGLRHLVGRYGIAPLGGVLELMTRRNPPERWVFLAGGMGRGAQWTAHERDGSEISGMIGF